MIEQHPITPPPELVQQWVQEVYGLEGVPGSAPGKLPLHIATQAARWGADQELEACCEWVYNSEYCQPHAVLHLRTARRPKPSSLKEQALAVLDDASDRLYAAHENILRRALEALDD